MAIWVLGLSHKTAPLEIRECVAFSEAELPAALSALRSLPGVAECALLSTCNRTEVYLVGAGSPQTEQVAGALSTLRHLPGDTLTLLLSVQHGAAAVRHVLRVAAGLESMVIGEQQILGQVRRAFDAARAGRTTGPVLNRLMQVAIVTGRRVRRETGLSRAASSVPHAARALCKKVFGSVHGRRVMVIGAGEMAALAIKVFATAQAHVAAVANRTLETARLLAGRIGAAAIPLDAVGTLAAEMDVIIVSIGAATPILSRRDLDGLADRAVPLLVIDLGVPRGVHPDVKGLPGVALYDLDDLAGFGATTPVDVGEISRADRIVDEALEVFMRWLASRAAAPVIAALRGRAEQIVADELARSHSRLRGLDQAQQEAVRAAMAAAMRKLLHAPIVRLRESAAAENPQVLTLTQELFDLKGSSSGVEVEE